MVIRGVVTRKGRGYWEGGVVMGMWAWSRAKGAWSGNAGVAGVVGVV